MATEALLDFEALLAPIPGDDPAGEPLPFHVKSELEKARKEDNPDPNAPADSGSQDEPKKADWKGIIRLAKETLTRTTKDLVVSARLTEALVKRHGFAGLRDGLRLMRRLVDECWDRLYPRLDEPDDLELRAGPFHWLDSVDRGAFFPSTIQQVPLVSDKADGQPPYEEVAGYGYLDVYPKHKKAVDRDEFKTVLQATAAQYLTTLAEDLDQCQEEVGLAVEVLKAKFGEAAAPGMIGVRNAVVECKGLMNQLLKERGDLAPPAAGAGDAGGPGPGPGPTRNGVAPGPLATRADAFNQIKRAAAFLKQLEPHSPIPYLIERAVELGQMDFRRLLQEYDRDPSLLAELRFVTGQENPDAAPS